MSDVLKALNNIRVLPSAIKAATEGGKSLDDFLI